MSEKKPHSLSEALSPVFLFLSTFRRNSATSTITQAELQDKLDRVLRRAREELEADDRLAKLVDRAWYPLVVTVDQIVLTSQWKGRVGWSVSLMETKYFETSEGGARFFRIVDEVLHEQGKVAAELAEFLFHCMAFGFQGELMGNRKELDHRKLQLYEKARLPIEISDQLAPFAYNRNVVRPMKRLPTVGVLRLAAVCVAVIVLSVIGINLLTKEHADRTARAADLMKRTIENLTVEKESARR